MKSLDELDRLGHVVDDAKLEEVNGGDWRSNMINYFHHSQKFWQGFGDLLEGAANRWD